MTGSRRAAQVLLLVALLAGTAADTRSAERPKAPDVLFIAIDDLNDWVGCLQGHPQTATPNIDRLASRGLLFTNAHCPAPMCNPSRAALLSGIRPHESGVYENGQPWRPAMPNVVTLPEHFKRNGYRVLAGGKIFHGSFNDRKAFDQYWSRPKDPNPKRDDLRRPQGNLAWGPLDDPDEAMGDYKLVDWAIEQIEHKRDKPLFLAVGFVKPHLEWYAPRADYEAFPLDDIQLPPLLNTDLEDVPSIGRAIATRDGLHAAVTRAQLHSEAVRAYLATVRFLDRQIGRLLDALDKSQRNSETIIVLWSDHGWHLGEKEHWKKFTLWERSTRVPLIVVAPGKTSPATRSNRSVSLMSIYPTLVELCGLPTPDSVKDPSLVPLLANPGAQWPHAALTTYRRGNHAVKTENWRYIRYKDGSEELYDLANDPNEWNNLATDPAHETTKAKLKSHLPRQDAPDASNARRRNKVRRPNKNAN